MNVVKLYKQFWIIVILLFVCIVINFVISLSGRGAGATDAELENAYARINVLEREVAYLTQQVDIQQNQGQGGKSIALELLESRVGILEQGGVGGDANVDRRLSQVEMKVSTLEKAFKQANNITPAAPPPQSQKPVTATNNNNNRPAAQTPSATTGNGRQPIQIQTGSGSAGGSAPVASSNAKYHVVQPGETLFRISRNYNLSVDELRRLNGLKESDVLKAGQRLKVSN